MQHEIFLHTELYMASIDNNSLFERFRLNPLERKGTWGIRVRRPGAIDVRSLRHGKVPANTLVGAYVGNTMTASAWQADSKRRRLLGVRQSEYGVQMFRYNITDGSVHDDLVMDPSNTTDGSKLSGRFLHNLVPYINEPSEAAPNCKWVRNYAHNRLEVWTRVDIAPGTELTLCYGVSFSRTGYPVGARVHCATRLNPRAKATNGPDELEKLEPLQDIIHPW
jgi:hypothetical protein